MIHWKTIEPSKWDKKFMKMAKAVADDNDICQSRKIGAVLVDPETKGVLSVAYNGPARGVPHCGTVEYRKFIWQNVLSNTERENYGYGAPTLEVAGSSFCFDFPEKCPRRVLGYRSGEGLHICQAAHCERNAILNAARNGVKTDKTTLYCWCCLPCSECAREIINAGVSRVVCLYSETTYDKLSHFIFEKAPIEVFMVKETDITEG